TTPNPYSAATQFGGVTDGASTGTNPTSLHGPSDAMLNPSQLLKVGKTLFQNSRRFTHFYRLSHSELVEHQSDTKSIHNDDGNPSRANIKQALWATYYGMQPWQTYPVLQCLYPDLLMRIDV
ncbi:hypothetical protein Tco_1340343, partial [Tanacetum coccineum]